MAQFILSAFADEADETLAGQIAAIQRNGIHCIEVRGMNGRPFVEHTVSEAQAVRRELDAHGITVSALGSPFGKISVRDPLTPHLEKFKHALELCHVMGTNKMRVFSFYIPEGEDVSMYRAQVMDRLDAFVEMARYSAGVRLAHENEKGIYGDITERCLDIAQTFEGRLGAIFDPANFLQCGVTPVEAMEALLPYVEWMHIKDVRLADGALAPAGEGDGDIPRLLAMLESKFPGGTPCMLTVEPHLALFKGFSDLERDAVLPAFQYRDNHQAFDAACTGIIGVLKAR